MGLHCARMSIMKNISELEKKVNGRIELKKLSKTITISDKKDNKIRK